MELRIISKFPITGNCLKFISIIKRVDNVIMLSLLMKLTLEPP